MFLRNTSQARTGLHQNSQTNTTAVGWRSFSFGYYMSSTSTNTNMIYFSVTSLPATFNMAFWWQCDSMRNSGNAENYIAVKTGKAHFSGYGFADWSTGTIAITGNGINQAGEVWGNGYNSVFIRDYAWAGTPVYVTYHLDVLCNNWDKINVNYS